MPLTLRLQLQNIGNELLILMSTVHGSRNSPSTVLKVDPYLSSTVVLDLDVGHGGDQRMAKARDLESGARTRCCYSFIIVREFDHSWDV